jgi:hypothetical protein
METFFVVNRCVYRFFCGAGGVGRSQRRLRPSVVGEGVFLGNGSVGPHRPGRGTIYSEPETLVLGCPSSIGRLASGGPGPSRVCGHGSLWFASRQHLRYCIWKYRHLHCFAIAARLRQSGLLNQEPVAAQPYLGLHGLVHRRRVSFFSHQPALYCVSVQLSVAHGPRRPHHLVVAVARAAAADGYDCTSA